MSLMSAIFGACSGIGASLFDGIWIADSPARAELLRFRRQRPVVPFLGVVEIGRALDDAHRADLEARALARRDILDRRIRCDGRVTTSCWKAMPISVSPRAAACAGAAPDLVYWLMFSLSAFR